MFQFKNTLKENITNKIYFKCVIKSWALLFIVTNNIYFITVTVDVIQTQDFYEAIFDKEGANTMRRHSP